MKYVYNEAYLAMLVDVMPDFMRFPSMDSSAEDEAGLHLVSGSTEALTSPPEQPQSTNLRRLA